MLQSVRGDWVRLPLQHSSGNTQGCRKLGSYSRSRVSRDLKMVSSQAAGHRTYFIRKYSPVGERNSCILWLSPRKPWSWAQFHQTAILSVPSRQLSVMNLPPLPLDLMENFYACIFSGRIFSSTVELRERPSLGHHSLNTMFFFPLPIPLVK